MTKLFSKKTVILAAFSFLLLSLTACRQPEPQHDMDAVIDDIFSSLNAVVEDFDEAAQKADEGIADDIESGFNETLDEVEGIDALGASDKTSQGDVSDILDSMFAEMENAEEYAAMDAASQKSADMIGDSFDQIANDVGNITL